MIRCKFLIVLLACHYCAAHSRVKTAQDNYLRENVIEYLDENENKCNSMHSYACGNNEASKFSEHAVHEYNKTIGIVENILSSVFDYGYESIAVEQDLYKECLNVGNENKHGLLEIKEELKFFEKLLVDITKEELKWQKVNHKIAQLGFGNAFFNIRVIRDPSNSQKQIIMIEPPTLMSLTNFLVALDRITEENLETLNSSNHTSIKPFFATIKKNGLQLVRQFVLTLVEIIQKTSSLDRSKIQSEKMTIAEWSKRYNRRSRDPKPTTEINWPEIIFHEFYKVNINLYDSEPIIVKNIHYFSLLFNTMFEYPNDIIGITVVAKAVYENMRYIDLDFAQDLQPLHRQAFCRSEIKLYGVSQKILFDLCKDAIDKKQTRKIQEIVYNIIESVKEAIREANISFTEEAYLITELQSIITHIKFLAELQHFDTNQGLENWSPSSLPRHYDVFKKGNSYFKTIRNYREMLKLKELRSLRSPSQALELTPFSLADLHVPANRFILNVFYNRAFFEHNYYKEQAFGTYGAKLATLLYGLLNENKATDNSYYDFDLRANPDFVLDEANCIDSEGDITSASLARKVNRIISSSVGLDIAYNAMNKPITKNVDLPAIINPLPFSNVWKSDQIFFLSYSLFHCKEESSILNDIISHSDKFIKSFPQCHSASACKVTPFNGSDKNIFLIKL